MTLDYFCVPGVSSQINYVEAGADNLKALRNRSDIICIHQTGVVYAAMMLGVLGVRTSTGTGILSMYNTIGTTKVLQVMQPALCIEAPAHTIPNVKIPNSFGLGRQQSD